MSMGFGLENINDMFGSGDGIPPEFTQAEMVKIEKKASESKEPYWSRAYSFVHAYKRGAEPWALMTKKQREWLWRIKDSLT